MSGVNILFPWLGEIGAAMAKAGINFAPETKQISVGTNAAPISDVDEIVPLLSVLADPNNTDVIYIGSVGGQSFPLWAANSVLMLAVRPKDIWARANSGTQTLDVIYLRRGI
jgi:hypothetical protein